MLVKNSFIYLYIRQVIWLQKQRFIKIRSVGLAAPLIYIP
jgi:hypothetical protein